MKSAKHKKASKTHSRKRVNNTEHLLTRLPKERVRLFAWAGKIWATFKRNYDELRFCDRCTNLAVSLSKL